MDGLDGLIGDMDSGIGPWKKPLGIDPEFALKWTGAPLSAQSDVPRPLVQFHIELAGPRTAPASTIKQLLEGQWAAALGEPAIYVMAAHDSRWRRLDAADTTGAYDSVLLAWPYLSARGKLTGSAGQRLMQNATQFAEGLQRRAVPIPMPDEIEAHVRGLQERQEAFDIGIELELIHHGNGYDEVDIWEIASAMGMHLDSQGAFQWHQPGWNEPLFGLNPGEPDWQFSLADATAHRKIEDLALGFSLPLAPDPIAQWRAMWEAATTLQQACGGFLSFDDEPILSREQAEPGIQTAVQAMKKAGLTPGSPECQALFGNALD